MTDHNLTLQVESRETGKAGRRSVEDNQVRGVIYGKSMPSTPVLADYNTLYKIFGRAGGNQIISLQVGDKESHDVLFKDVDYHPVTNRIRHFDMYAVTKGEKITVEVPIILTDVAPAIQQGMNVVTFMDSVEVTAVPRKLPESFEVSLAGLEKIGDTILISAIAGDPDVEILGDIDAVIAKVEEIQEMQVEDDSPQEMPDAETEGGEGSSEEAASDSETSETAA